MLETKDLRIGNYLFYDCPIYEGQKPEIVKINRITENFILDDKNKNSIIGDLESYKPIKIEKDFFLKFDLIVLLKEFEHKLSKKIEYLHEFQNIYFLLMGKEIEIEM